MKGEERKGKGEEREKRLEERKYMKNKRKEENRGVEGGREGKKKRRGKENKWDIRLNKQPHVKEDRFREKKRERALWWMLKVKGHI